MYLRCLLTVYEAVWLSISAPTLTAKILYFLQRLTSYIPVLCDPSCPFHPSHSLTPPPPIWHCSVTFMLFAFYSTLSNINRPPKVSCNNVSTTLCSAAEQWKTRYFSHWVNLFTLLTVKFSPWLACSRLSRGSGDDRDEAGGRRAGSATSGNQKENDRVSPEALIFSPRSRSSSAAFFITATPLTEGLEHSSYPLTFCDLPTLSNCLGALWEIYGKCE